MTGYLKWRKGEETKKTFGQYRCSAKQDWSANLVTQERDCGGSGGWGRVGDMPKDQIPKKTKKGDFGETLF